MLSIEGATNFKITWH